MELAWSQSYKTFFFVNRVAEKARTSVPNKFFWLPYSLQEDYSKNVASLSAPLL
jgi:hypothetical protein